MHRALVPVVLRWLLCVALCAPALAQTGAPAARPAVADSKPLTDAAAPLLQRPVVLGASVSDGFLLNNEAGGSVTMAHYLDAAIRGAHTPALDCADLMFFEAPTERGPALVQRALGAQPSVVIALDFLFWYAYGVLPDEAARLALFEQGLAQLERFQCPVVLGDLPDMRRALGGAKVFGQAMLVAAQVPEPEALAALNARLDRWVEERANVCLVRLSRFVAQVEQGQTIELRGNRWSKDDLPRLQQPDLLHTTLEGTAAVTLLALDGLMRCHPEILEQSFELQAPALRQAMLDLRAEERAKREERERKLEERRREREAGGGRGNSKGGERAPTR